MNSLFNFVAWLVWDVASVVVLIGVAYIFGCAFIEAVKSCIAPENKFEKKRNIS